MRSVYLLGGRAGPWFEEWLAFRVGLQFSIYVLIYAVWVFNQGAGQAPGMQLWAVFRVR